MNKKILFGFILILGLVALVYFFYYRGPAPVVAPDFKNEKVNLIRLVTPAPNQRIKSPVFIEGEARGFWFFEGTFPIVIVNWDGLIIGEGYATVQGEWMTEEFVPFKATVEFKLEKPAYSDRGALILKKDNPSGLPEYDDALEIPVFLE